MPSNVDFSAGAFDPLERVQKASSYVDNLYQYAAKQDAGRLYAAGDVAGASRRLAGAGDIAGASKLSYDAQDQAIQNATAQQTFMKSAAPLLAQGYAAKGAAGLKEGWDSYVAPHLKSLGAKDEDLSRLGQMIQSNPDVLNSIVQKEFAYEKSGNDVLVIDKANGQLVRTIKGAAQKPDTRTRFDGLTEIQEELQPDGTWKEYGRGPRSTAGEGGSGADWQFLQDSDGTPFRANRATGEILGPDNKPYTPKAIQKIGTAPKTDFIKLLDTAGRTAATMDGVTDPEYLKTLGVKTLKEITDSGVKNPFIDLALGTEEPADIRAALDAVKRTAVDQRTRFTTDAANTRAANVIASRPPPKPYSVPIGNELVTYGYDPEKKTFTEIGRAPRSATAAIDPLPDSTIESLVQTYRATGKVPIFGIGATGNANRTKFYNEYDRQLRAAGLTGLDAAADQADFTANRGALNRMTILQSNVRQYEDTARRNADLVLETGLKGAGPSQIPLFNAWINAGRKAAGSKEVVNFHQAMETFLTEYAKVMQGATGASGATVEAMQRAENLIRTSDNWDTVQSSIALLKREMKNREDALEDEVQTRRGMLRGKGLGTVKNDAGGTGGVIRYDKQGNRIP